MTLNKKLEPIEIVIEKENFLKLTFLDQMPAIFMSIIGSLNQWLFVGNKILLEEENRQAYRISQNLIVHLQQG